MSASEELDLLQKKKTELENEWAFLEQKEQAMKESARRLLEKVAALLAEKKATLEKLEYALKDLEKKLAELQANRVSNEPITLLGNEEESEKQIIVVAEGGS